MSVYFNVLIRKNKKHLNIFNKNNDCTIVGTLNPVMALVRCERSGRTRPFLKNIKKWSPEARYCSISS